MRGMEKSKKDLGKKIPKPFVVSAASLCLLLDNARQVKSKKDLGEIP
jgi:hypothetical protein